MAQEKEIFELNADKFLQKVEAGCQIHSAPFKTVVDLNKIETTKLVTVAK